MILDEYLLEKVKRYCELIGIPFKGGRLSNRHKKEIQDFIYAQLKLDRIATKKKEGEIESILAKIINISKFTESPIEEYLLGAIAREGLTKHCRPQFEIGKCRVDFAFPIANLAVECNGREYHFTEQEQIERDQRRDKYLARKGWRVLHIEGLAIRRNIDLCIKKIKEALEPFIK